MDAPHRSTLQQVLVPLDGSPLAEEAIPVAGAIAHRIGASIHLVTVQRPLVPPGAEFGIGASEDAVSGSRDDIDVYLAMMTAKLARMHGVHAASAVLMGAPAERLAEYAQTHGITLIVMTTHGRGGFSRFWLGSVADELVRRIEVPVLLLRHGARSEDAVFHRITIALDGTPTSEQAIEPAIALGSSMPHAEYTLIRVVEPFPPPMVTPVGVYPPDTGARSLERLGTAAAEYLEQVADRMRELGLAVQTRVLVGGVPEEVVGFAERSHAQLIALATRGARGMDRLILGSVADKVVRSAVQPVLVVHGGAQAGWHGPPIVAAGAISSSTENEVSRP
jgi:nucleotide-binding universal stress UspA family protein